MYLGGFSSLGAFPKTTMEGKFCFKAHFWFFVLLGATKSHELEVANNRQKNCSCYDRCLQNFTTKSVNDDQYIGACQRGCRFYSLTLHASHEFNLASDYARTREECLISCGKSYIKSLETSACNFGCSSVKLNDSCDFMEKHLPQITYSFLIEESDMFIHSGDPDPDDVLIDPGLKSHLEKTMESLLESNPKLPEIYFKNLPVSNQELTKVHSRPIFKCPKFYGFDPSLQFRNGKTTISDLVFFFGVLVFAVICFSVSKNLEKQRKLWKQLLTSVMQSKFTLVKADDNLVSKEPFLNDFPTKEEACYMIQQPIEENYVSKEMLDSNFDKITFVFYNEHGNAKV